MTATAERTYWATTSASSPNLGSWQLTDCSSWRQPVTWTAKHTAWPLFPCLTLDSTCRHSWTTFSWCLQGRSDGGYIGTYTLPKAGQINFLWSNNDVGEVSELSPQWVLYLPQNYYTSQKKISGYAPGCFYSSPALEGLMPPCLAVEGFQSRVIVQLFN